MAPSDLQAYLAAKYMTGVKADAILAREEGKKKKSKKRKADEGASLASGGLVVDDDAMTGWNKVQDEDEEAQPGALVPVRVMRGG